MFKHKGSSLVDWKRAVVREILIKCVLSYCEGQLYSCGAHHGYWHGKWLGQVGWIRVGLIRLWLGHNGFG